MLLTEQEIALWLHIADEPINFARAIESAVLEKLKAQEPAAWRYKMAPPGWTYNEKKPNQDVFGVVWEQMQVTPLYLHPLSPDDVVQDAERYRWLRNSGKGDNLIKYDCRGVYLPESSALDRAIDAAMGK